MIQDNGLLSGLGGVIAPQQEQVKTAERQVITTTQKPETSTQSLDQTEHQSASFLGGDCRPVHTTRPGFDTAQVREYMEYAYSLGGMDFVLLLNSENGARDPHRQSSVPDNRPGMGANGREDSRGFCQFHRRRHKDKVDNPLFRSDRKRQMDRCYEAYVGGTRFYAGAHKHTRGSAIKEVCE